MRFSGISPKNGIHADQFWIQWTDINLHFFKLALQQLGIYGAINATQYPLQTHVEKYATMLSTFCLASNTCFTFVGELGFSLWEMREITGLPI